MEGVRSHFVLYCGDVETPPIPLFLAAKEEYDIEEYSFSQTTLEQVFLKFAQYDEVNGE